MIVLKKEGARFGFRFPAPSKKSNLYQAAVNKAEAAPKYYTAVVGESLYHIALYDINSTRDLVELLQMVEKIYRSSLNLIEHTTDGETFFQDKSMPWACFHQHIAGIVGHPPRVCRKRYFYGCSYALRGKEYDGFGRDDSVVFVRDVHGEFTLLNDNTSLPVKSSSLEEKYFVLNKSAIMNSAIRLIRLYHADKCPGFDVAALKRNIDNLPEAVKTCDYGDWDTVYHPYYGVYFQFYKGDNVIDITEYKRK